MYSIEVQINGLQKRRKSTGLLHIVAGFFLMATASQYYQLTGYQSVSITVLSFITAFISLVYGLFRAKLDVAAKYNSWVRLLQTLTFFVLTLFSFSAFADFRSYSLLLWMGISIVLMITERKLFQNPLLLFNQQHITLPGYAWNKEILWNKIQNVVVRPDFITIYYPDNRFIQFEVAHHCSNSDLENINRYCQQQLGQVSLS